MALPKDFPALQDAQINDNTQGYTQSPGGALADGQYSWIFLQMYTYLLGKGMVRIIDGEYTSDAAAITGGGSTGEYYRLAPGNIYGIPSDGGIIKRIQS